MKSQFYFTSYVDDLLIASRGIQISVLIFIFMSKSCFKYLWSREAHASILLKNNSLWTIPFSSTNLQLSWSSWFSYFNSKVSFKGCKTIKKQFSCQMCVFLNKCVVWINFCYFFFLVSVLSLTLQHAWF